MSKIQNIKSGANAHRFAPAAPDDDVYGACCPGWHSAASHADALADWVGFMERRGIQRVCCLVPGGQCDDAGNDLVGYRRAFGENAVLHAPTPDNRLVDASLLEETILPFLDDAVAADEPVVVHCLAGICRTGQVLAAWLAHDRDSSAERAMETVREMGREPCDVVESGQATEEELLDLIASVR